MSRTEESPLPLADVLSPGFTLEWSDSVAIALQLADQLSPGREPVATFPHIDRIALSPSGFLLTQLEPWAGEPLAGFGRLLRQLLRETTPPAALRLLVMQASSTVPTILFDDLIRELAKWDVQDRRTTLGELYQRVIHQRTAAASASFSALEITREPFRGPRLRFSSQTLLNRVTMATSIVGAVAVGVAALLYGRSTPDAPHPLLGVEISAASGSTFLNPSSDPSSGLTTSAEPIIEPVVPSGATVAIRSASVAAPVAVTHAERVSPSVLGAVSPLSDASLPPAFTMTAPATVRATITGRGGPEVVEYSPVVLAQAEEQFRRARQLFEQHDYAAAAAGFLEVVNVLERGDPTLELRQIAAELAGASRALSSNAKAEAARVFTTADPGVVEPVARAVLPPAAAAGTPANQIGVLEVLIDARGHVESAHLMVSDQHFRDRWLISAAKAWLFEPATLDGKPVRFLKRHTFLLDRSAGRR